MACGLSIVLVRREGFIYDYPKGLQKRRYQRRRASNKKAVLQYEFMGKLDWPTMASFLRFNESIR